MTAWKMIEDCMRLQTVPEMTLSERLTAGLIGGPEQYEGHLEHIDEERVERDFVPLEGEDNRQEEIANA